MTIANQIITVDSRISVTESFRDFVTLNNLHISNVQEDDQGEYMCQLNTFPPLANTVTLKVNQAKASGK